MTPPQPLSKKLQIQGFRLDSTPSQPLVFGPLRKLDRQPVEVSQALDECLRESEIDAILCWGFESPEPPETLLRELLARPGDIWHAGLRLGTSGLPELLDSVRPTWMYNRDPDAAIQATSWRLTLDACLIRSGRLQTVSSLDPGFKTLLGAGMEWGYRAIEAGAVVRHEPRLLQGKSEGSQEFPFGDELRFIALRHGHLWARWGLLRSLLRGRVGLLDGWRLGRALPGPASAAISPLIAPPKAPAATKGRVSVLIPTLDRYSYLERVLEPLLEQSIAPHEVLVVDQTPEARRQTGIEDRLGGLPLTVLHRQQAGQCSSRNAGLRRATGDFVLFLDDDDDEIPPDLIERHLANLQQFGAAASCGVADEVGAGDLPEAFQRWRLSDVFPTNNAMLRCEVLSKTGLFDLAFEHGERADADLGMRVYLTGGLSILDPASRVLHHRAGSGGLRTWGARRKTYAASRRALWLRHLPSVTEIYLALRYFSPLQVREKLWIAAFATLRSEGGQALKILRLITGSLLLPWTAAVLVTRRRKAVKMLDRFPEIPSIDPEAPCAV